MTLQGVKVKKFHFFSLFSKKTGGTPRHDRLFTFCKQKSSGRHGQGMADGARHDVLRQSTWQFSKTLRRSTKNSSRSARSLKSIRLLYLTSQPALGFCQPFSGGASPAFQQWSVSSTSPSLKVDQSVTFLILVVVVVLNRLM